MKVMGVRAPGSRSCATGSYWGRHVCRCCQIRSPVKRQIAHRFNWVTASFMWCSTWGRVTKSTGQNLFTPGNEQPCGRFLNHVCSRVYLLPVFTCQRLHFVTPNAHRLVQKFVSEWSSGWNMLYDHFCQLVDSQEILIKEESKKFLKYKNRQALVS